MFDDMADTTGCLAALFVTAIGGVFATVCGGMLLDWLSPDPREPSPTPPPRPPASFAEQVQGSYQLIAWDEILQQGVTLYIEPKEGTLTVDDEGQVDWSLVIQQVGERGPPRARIECRGRLDLGTRTVNGTPGPGNRSIDWDRNIMSVEKYVWLAYCGWNAGAPPAPFGVSLEGGLLQMSNSRGRFTWRRK